MGLTEKVVGSFSQRVYGMKNGRNLNCSLPPAAVQFIRANYMVVYQDDSVSHRLLELGGWRQLLAQAPLHPLLGLLQMAKVLVGDLEKK